MQMNTDGEVKCTGSARVSHPASLLLSCWAIVLISEGAGLQTRGPRFLCVRVDHTFERRLRVWSPGQASLLCFLTVLVKRGETKTENCQ